MCYYASFNKESSRRLIKVIERETADMRALWTGNGGNKEGPSMACYNISTHRVGDPNVTRMKGDQSGGQDLKKKKKKKKVVKCSLSRLDLYNLFLLI